MSYRYKTLSISKLSIIGAGQIGPDICLHFSKVFSKSSVELILVDISNDALSNAKTRIEKKIQRGVESGAFRPAMAETMRNSISYTTDYQAIAGSAVVLEAATEDEKIKKIIFSQVEEICGEKCLFLSNSSHMRPEVIFQNIVEKERCLVTHYFFPAERNPVVEIVPGADTSETITTSLMEFYEAIGKVPIRVESSYGYAIDPIFEGLCQMAILCLENGYGTVKEIDAAACKALGLGVGPFTALTLTGGNPITDHGLDEMNHELMPWFKSPKTLQEEVRNGTSWEIAQRGEEVNIASEKEAILEKQFLGAYFALSSFIIDKGISNVNDLDMACEIALVMKAPFTLMNKLGLNNVYQLVEDFCNEQDGFSIPASLEAARAAGKWEISRIVKKLEGRVAVFTIRRPKVLNALNLGVIAELEKGLLEAEKDTSVIGSVITGFGVKAFVSGADINMLASLKTADQGYENARSFQTVFSRIQALGKPVVCAMNGFAFGGGNELAMSCSARICRKGLAVLVRQPEVNLGFIPGAGATQRLPRLVGVDIAAEILRTGRTISSKEATEIGLVHKEVESNLIEAAIFLVGQLADGSLELAPIAEHPLSQSGDISDLDIGHLSQKIDSLITEAIYGGSKMTLDAGLDFEAQLFGQCLETKDMKIGLANFLTNGPRAKAKFVHK